MLAPFTSQKAEDGGNRCQPDAAGAQSGGVEPVLVELEAVGQHVGDALVQRRDEDAPDAAVSHSRDF